MSEAPPVEVTLREITELVRTFKESGWASLDLELHGVHLVLGRDGPPSTVAPAPAPAPTRALDTPTPAAGPSLAAAPTPTVTPASPSPSPSAPAPADVPANAIEVFSPAVGSFWLAPSPGEAPFAVLGQRIEVDQQLGIVEVMKLMSQVSSPVAGTVVAVCAANADLVEYGQVLFLIDPADD